MGGRISVLAASINTDKLPDPRFHSEQFLEKSASRGRRHDRVAPGGEGAGRRENVTLPKGGAVSCSPRTGRT
jgi:hypothetical protein